MATVANIGDIEIIAVTDGDAAPVDPAWPFPNVPAAAWRDARFALDDDGRHRSNFGAFVLRSRSETVLIDTGLGPGSWEIQAPSADAGHLLDSLSAVNISPGSITCVVMTHIHFDHVGWNVTSSESDSATPMFPKARYLAPKADWDHWKGNTDPSSGHHQRAFRDSVVPLQELGVLELVTGETRSGARRTDFTHPRPHAGPSVFATGIRSGTRDRDRRCVPFVGTVHISGLVSPGRYRPGNGQKIQSRVAREAAT